MLHYAFRSFSFFLLSISCGLPATAQSFQNAGQQPNILWLTTEDIGPHLGCYGDTVARTPNLDLLAKRGMVYDVAWSNYPVCASARSTIITGMYPASHGAGHHRCLRPLPENCRMFPQYLKDRGYYCTNSSKEDYNFPKPGKVWHESNRKADYQNRTVDQPFFAVFNQTCTHEGQIRKRPHEPRILPSAVSLPAYWPESLDIRKDWAQYYDKIADMDNWVGSKLRQLEDRKLSENTIVFFFGDHGAGMPRHKRFAGDSGMRVPLIVYFPDKWKHLAPADYQQNSHSSELVGFVDLAPTILSLVGIKPKKYMHGRALAGKFQSRGEDCLFGYRARMDERPDLSRSIRDQRFVYVRNYMIHLSGGQHLDYQDITPTTKVWREKFVRGELNSTQRRFFEPHPPEELFDLNTDPEETVNLAADPKFSHIVKRFRKLHRNKTIEIRDVGLMPESLIQEVADREPLQNFCNSDKNYPVEKVLRAANVAASDEVLNTDELKKMAESKNAAIRYWAAIALLCRGELECRKHSDLIQSLMSDSANCVAITAAEAAAKYLDGNPSARAVNLLVHKSNINNSEYYSAVDALNSLSRLAEQGAMGSEFPLQKLKAIPIKDPKINRGDTYLARLTEFIESRVSEDSAKH